MRYKQHEPLNPTRGKLKIAVLVAMMLVCMACPAVIAQHAVFEGRRVTEYSKEHMSFYHVKVKEVYFIYIDDNGNEIKHGLESIYSNGELSYTGVYRNGKRDGVFIGWSSGRKVGEQRYKNGVDQGYYKQTDWFTDAVKRWEQEKQENGVYTDKFWNRRGELLSQGTSRVGDKSVEKWEGTFLRTGKDEVWVDTYKNGKKVSEQKSSLD